MQYSDTLKKRFAKDYSLPITVFQSPYFEYLLDLYDPLFNTNQAYSEFVELVEELGGEAAFFQESKRIIRDVIGALSENMNNSGFNTFDTKRYTKNVFKKLDGLYHPDNANRSFVSIDIKKANYQAVRAYDPSIVFDTPSYEELLRRFTDKSYFVKSKQIRQVIFGNLNPKRQQVLQKSIVADLKAIITNEFKEIDVSFLSPDELVIGVSHTISEREIKKVVEASSLSYIDFHIRQFKLYRIGDKPYYKREYLDKTFDLKCVPAHYFAEVYKFVLGKKITEMDRVSLLEGRLVQFKEPLFGGSE